MGKDQPVQITSTAQAPEPDRDSRGNILPHVSAKWGTTPKASTLSTEEEKARQQALEDFYTEEEKEKMRKKGINPLLKAEMEINKSKEGDFWGKVAGTVMGGGAIR